MYSRPELTNRIRVSKGKRVTVADVGDITSSPNSRQRMHKVSLLAASWTVHVYVGDRERNGAFRDFMASVFVNIKFPTILPFVSQVFL